MALRTHNCPDYSLYPLNELLEILVDEADECYAANELGYHIEAFIDDGRRARKFSNMRSSQLRPSYKRYSPFRRCGFPVIHVPGLRSLHSIFASVPVTRTSKRTLHTA